MFSAESEGISFDLLEDRLEIVQRKRRQTIPLANIVEVLVARRPKRLVVVTTEGKHYEYLLGHEVEPARAAVAAQMSRALSHTPQEPR